MDADLADAETARMTTFLNKGKERQAKTKARLEALRDTSSDNWKSFRDGTDGADGETATEAASAAAGAFDLVDAVALAEDELEGIDEEGEEGEGEGGESPTTHGGVDDDDDDDSSVDWDAVGKEVAGGMAPSAPASPGGRVGVAAMSPAGSSARLVRGDSVRSASLRSPKARAGAALPLHLFDDLPVLEEAPVSHLAAKRVGTRDIVSRPTVLRPSGNRREGPRTRFGDGDGSWWDRWLGFEPPRVSSYSQGFVAPLNGYKRAAMLAERGAWVDDPAHRSRLVPRDPRGLGVTKRFADTLLARPADVDDSSDSLDVSSSESDGESDDDGMAGVAVERIGTGDSSRLPSRAGSLPPLSPLRSLPAMGSYAALDGSGGGAMAMAGAGGGAGAGAMGGIGVTGSDAALALGSQWPPRPRSGGRRGSAGRDGGATDASVGAGRAGAEASGDVSGAGVAAGKGGGGAPLTPGRAARLQPLPSHLVAGATRPRSSSFVPAQVLSSLGRAAYEPPPGTDSEESSTESELDPELIAERELTKKFVGTRARWKLFMKYRTTGRAHDAHHIAHPGDSDATFLGPHNEPARQAALAHLDAATSPREWVRSHRVGSPHRLQLKLPSSSSRARSNNSSAGGSTGGMQASYSLPVLSATGEASLLGDTWASMSPDALRRTFERPTTAVGASVPTSARQRFVQHCRAKHLPPEPLIIGRKETRQLKLPHYGIGNRVAGALAAGLSNMQQLEFVDLRNNRLSGKAVRDVCKALASTDVVMLDLSMNRIGPTGCQHLGQLVAASRTLAYLNLDRCKVADRGVKALVNGLADPDCSLTRLILSNNNLGSTSGVALARVLNSNTSLHHLDLSWNAIRLNGARDIAIALKQNTSLQTLDVAWNGFSQKGSEYMGFAIAVNTTLRKLDLSHNSVGATSALVVANNLKKNSTLTNIQMNGNPLGMAGGRALLRCMDNTGDVRVIGLEECNFEMETKVAFDPSNPAGVFTLDMEKPYDVTVGEELLRLAADLPGCVITRCAVAASGRAFKVQRLTRNVQRFDGREASGDFDGEDKPEDAGKREEDEEDEAEVLSDSDSDTEEAKTKRKLAVVNAMVKNFRAYMGDASGAEWKLPETGKVEFVVTYRPQRVKKWQAAQTNGVSALLNMLKRKNVTARDKKRLLNMASTDMFFSAEQASTLVGAISDTSGSKAGVALDAVYNLLPRLVDPENSKDLIEAHLDPTEQRKLAFKLGQLARFSVDNPSGHYRLDLAVETDRRLLDQLLSVAGDEASESKRSGYGDTSQWGNWENFRNATLNEEEFKMESDFPLHETTTGIIEFDYASTKRPRRYARRMRRKAFGALRKKLVEYMARLELPHPTVTQGNPQWIPPAVEAAEDLHPDSPEALEQEPTEEQQSILDEALSLLRLTVAKTYLETSQAIGLVKVFPCHLGTARMRAVVNVFGRLLKLTEFEQVRNLVPRIERRQLLMRIGWLNGLNPFNPDAFYVVDLERHEERYLAIMLVDLAVAEPGENWEDETFNGISGWELPMSWTKEVPFKGNLTLTYTTTGPGCAPDWDCRKRLKEFFLCGR